MFCMIITIKNIVLDETKYKHEYFLKKNEFSARARLQRVRIIITMLLAAQMSLQTVKKETRYNRAPVGVI